MIEKQEGFMHCTLLQVTSYHGPGGLDLIDQCRCILDIFIVGVQQFLSILQLFAGLSSLQSVLAGNSPQIYQCTNELLPK